MKAVSGADGVQSNEGISRFEASAISCKIIVATSAFVALPERSRFSVGFLMRA